MLVGETPFYSETLVGTYTNIMQHDRTLRFPNLEDRLSDDAEVMRFHFVRCVVRLTTKSNIGFDKKVVLCA